MSQSMRNQDHSTTPTPTQPRRRHRLARFLWTLVILLLVLVVAAIWGLHRLGMTQNSLSGISGQLHNQSTRLSSINGRLQALLITVQNGFHKLSNEVATLIRMARQHL